MNLMNEILQPCLKPINNLIGGGNVPGQSVSCSEAQKAHACDYEPAALCS